ncbi:MAG: molybdopterin molybdotransferase MoeA [Actinomycetaceae bacterium]|nr:molybdopterin molybdotransferase MoeA [Actinomycetaceae bacterium]MDO5746980.1 molybdopterin molybdotransferase MoeA [Actinomycetaceae bacterium]
MTLAADVLGDCLEIAAPLESLEVLLIESVGCVLANDVYAPNARPMADTALCDGYATSSRATSKATRVNPLELRVLADISADGTYYQPSGGTQKGRLKELGDGVAPASVDALTAYRIASGAALPVGADCVVPLEFSDEGAALVRIHTPVLAGDNMLHAGADVEKNSMIMRRGTRIDARQVALLAGVGIQRVRVHPRPRVVIISVGDELVDNIGQFSPSRVPDAQSRGGHHVFDTNSHALSVALSELGASVARFSSVPDSPHAVQTMIERHIARADVIIVTGGIGSQRSGAVMRALEEKGTVDFEDIDMLPVQRIGYGTVDDVPIYCLPGQPSAALIAYEIFVRPALKLMTGTKKLFRSSVRARIDRGWLSPLGYRQMVCAVVRRNKNGDYIAEIPVEPEQQLLSELASANALAVVTEDVQSVSAGDILHCMMLDDDAA